MFMVDHVKHPMTVAMVVCAIWIRVYLVVGVNLAQEILMMIVYRQIFRHWELMNVEMLVSAMKVRIHIIYFKNTH